MSRESQPVSIYADNFRSDAEKLASDLEPGLRKIKARLKNAADVMDRHAERREAARFLADEVEHVLSQGEIGKQSSRRLKSALKTYRSVS